ncbi:MAG: aminotransferase class V-fold PLP-dependent enzyme [Rhodospirillales bacterium]
MIKTSPEQVIFTSGGTEANNLVIDGINRDFCLISAIEHDSVLQTNKMHEKISVDEGGVVELGALEKLLQEKNSANIVSVMLANNETGVIQPIKEIVRLSDPFDTFIHTDAIQACGKINLDWSDLGVDAMSLSAHKIGGPQGVGALILNKSFDLDPRFFWWRTRAWLSPWYRKRAWNCGLWFCCRASGRLGSKRRCRITSQ